jgi:putative restriction endonuclease
MNDYFADEAMRQEAFAHIQRIKATRGHLTSEDIGAGFIYNGQRIPLVNPRRGIFKPAQMRHLLSIRTVFPKPGNRVWYDDQRQVHEQIYGGEEFVDYAFMGTDPDANDNRLLKEAFLNRVPLVYFLGIAPGRYEAMLPVFVQDWDRASLKARLAFAIAEGDALVAPSNTVERRYALRIVKQRLHQASFREAVINAYDGRCALSNLPEQSLLDAAHIMADAHEQLGQPIVSNGLPLSKIHHAAFDAHLIGIDPDRRIHVARRLLDQSDGPILESLKKLDGARLREPRRAQDRPDRDRLAARFELFRQASA